jgi:hypothetical protein
MSRAVSTPRARSVTIRAHAWHHLAHTGTARHTAAMAQNFAVMVYLPRGVADTVTNFTGTSTSAVALPSGATRVRFEATETCHIIFGSSAVAAAVVATCMPYDADTAYVFDVAPGQTHFRVIRSSATGDLYMAAVA